MKDFFHPALHEQTMRTIGVSVARDPADELLTAYLNELPKAFRGRSILSL